MYFCDKHGLVWKQEGEIFRNVGLEVKEKTVTFKKLESVKVLPGTVTASSLNEAIPLTLRQAVSKLKISEDSPLEPLKNLSKLEVLP